MPLTVPDPSLPHPPVTAPTLGFLLRELYGMQADEILNGSESVHSGVTRLPSAGAHWPQPIPQAA